MSSPKALLEQYELSPKKSLGQNFLHDPNALEKIIATADLMPEDTVLEIGAGTGALTERLAEYVRHVFSLEVDDRLRPLLEDRLAQYNNIYMLFDDILKVDVLKLVGTKDFVVVANLPYYITTPILHQLLEAHRRPRRLVLLVQAELADRIVARPPDMSRLAVLVQFFGKANIVTRLKPAAFWPRPEIDSALLKIDPYTVPEVDVPDSAMFFRVVRAGFSQKRKQLKNAVGGGLGIKATAAGELLTEAGIDPKRRAETLTLAEWAALTRTYSSS